MNITFTKSRSTAIFGVLLLLVAAVGAGMAAPSVDSEATDTPTESELTDGYTQPDFNASDDAQLPTLQASYASQNPEIQLVDPASGVTIKTITNDSDSDMFESTGDDGSGTYYYNTTLNESFFALVPMDANQSKNVTLRLIDNSSVDDPGSAAMTNITVTLNNTGERAVYNALTQDTDGVDTEENEPGFFSELLGGDTENTSTVEADSVGINGEETDVYVVYQDDGVASAYEDAAEEKSTFFGLSSSDYDAGDRIKDQVVTAEGTPYVVYSSEAAESVLDATGATYATYESVDGEPAHRLVLGEDFEDESSIDVETRGNERLSITETFDVVSYEDGFMGYSLSLGFGGLGAVLLFAGRPSVEREGDETEA